LLKKQTKLFTTLPGNVFLFFVTRQTWKSFVIERKVYDDDGIFDDMLFLLNMYFTLKYDNTVDAKSVKKTGGQIFY